MTNIQRYPNTEDALSAYNRWPLRVEFSAWLAREEDQLPDWVKPGAKIWSEWKQVLFTVDSVARVAGGVAYTYGGVTFSAPRFSTDCCAQFYVKEAKFPAWVQPGVRIWKPTGTSVFTVDEINEASVTVSDGPIERIILLSAFLEDPGYRKLDIPDWIVPGARFIDKTNGTVAAAGSPVRIFTVAGIENNAGDITPVIRTTDTNIRTTFSPAYAREALIEVTAPSWLKVGTRYNYVSTCGDGFDSPIVFTVATIDYAHESITCGTRSGFDTFHNLTHPTLGLVAKEVTGTPAPAWVKPGVRMIKNEGDRVSSKECTADILTVITANPQHDFVVANTVRISNDALTANADLGIPGYSEVKLPEWVKVGVAFRYAGKNLGLTKYGVVGSINYVTKTVTSTSGTHEFALFDLASTSHLPKVDVPDWAKPGAWIRCGSGFPLHVEKIQDGVIPTIQYTDGDFSYAPTVAESYYPVNITPWGIAEVNEVLLKKMDVSVNFGPAQQITSVTSYDDDRWTCELSDTDDYVTAKDLARNGEVITPDGRRPCGTYGWPK